MINCYSKTCRNNAYYGYALNDPIYCKKHKLSNMYIVVYNLCYYKNCNIVATFSNLYNKKNYCKKHKTVNMINIKYKSRCQFNNCYNKANYGTLNIDSKYYCDLHKHENDIKISFYKCNYNNCTSKSYFGYLENYPLYCSLHNTNNINNINISKYNNITKNNKKYQIKFLLNKE